jgi:hypothetical protein
MSVRQRQVALLGQRLLVDLALQRFQLLTEGAYHHKITAVLCGLQLCLQLIPLLDGVPEGRRVRELGGDGVALAHQRCVWGYLRSFSRSDCWGRDRGRGGSE